MESLLTRATVPAYHLWKFSLDETKAVIENAKDACRTGKGQVVLSTNLENVKIASGKYEERWSLFSTKLTGSNVPSEPFVKEHATLSKEILDTLDLVSEALDHVSLSVNPRTPSHCHHTDFKLKLPEIKLPEFHGELENWSQFWDLFTSLVDKRLDLPVSVKFTYLRNALRGPSARLISGFSITAENYDEAKQLLLDHYQDSKRIKRRLIYQLLDLKSPPHGYKDLSEYRVKYNQVLRSLKAYENVETSEWLIVEVLLKKLSKETQMLLFNHHKTQFFSFGDFDETLKVLVDLLESSRSSTNKGDHAEKLKKDSSSPKSKVMWQTTTDQQSSVSCDFCAEQHPSHKCPTFVSVDDRKKCLIKQRRCLTCGKKGHYAPSCHVKLKCSQCGSRHWTPLCYKSNTSRVKGSPSSAGSEPFVDASPSPVSPRRLEGAKAKKSIPVNNSLSENVKEMDYTADSQSVVSRVANEQGRGTALPTAMLSVRSRTKGHKGAMIRCFFDTGSQRSFIHPVVMRQLGLCPSGETVISLNAFGHSAEPLRCPVLKLRLALGNKVVQVEFLVTDKVDMKLHSPGLRKAVERLKSKGVRLTDREVEDDVKDVAAVIGADHFAKFVRGVKRVDGVDVFCTAGGCMIYGNLPFDGQSVPDQTTLQSITVSKISLEDVEVEMCDVNLVSEPPVSQLWELDYIGITDDKFTPSERNAIQLFSETIEYREQKYWVRLPWKVSPEILPTNYRMAVGQFSSLMRNLQKTPRKLKLYDDVIQDYIRQGFIEEVKNPSIKGHYLPHHAVMKESVTTPLRIVFNASAKIGSGSISLNEALETGPSLTEKLIDSLLSFRVGYFGMTADISKAFLRIGLRAVDRDYVRFLWANDPQSTPQTYRFKSVLFGSTSSPFLLQATLYKHFSESTSPLKDSLLKAFYVDNFLITVDSENELFQVHQEATQCLESAGMPLQEWNSNHQGFNQFVNDDKRKITPSILGVTWDTGSDLLYIKPVYVDPVDALTKRKALSICSKLYDPLGLISPISIKGKLFIRNLWKLKVDWDEFLGEEVIVEFNRLISEYRDLSCIVFPRAVATKPL